MNLIKLKTVYLVTYCLILILTSYSIGASTLAEFSFTDPTQTQAFRSLMEQLRCLVCQNESLAASQADLAQDLRREIYGMMQAGQTSEQIINFLVARYGDFVLYNPPLKPATYPLWYGPFVLLGLAGFFLVRALVRHQRTQETALSQAEIDRLAAIIADHPPTNQDSST